MHQEHSRGPAILLPADERIRDDLGPDADADADAEAGHGRQKALGTILHRVLPIVALAAVAVVGWREIRHLDIAEIHHSFQAIGLGATLVLLLAGLAAASLNTLYDALLRRWLALEIGPWTWCARPGWPVP
ncbi:hypothetical protein [Imhoffiella purpurea]|uniref:Uncharacterized protein n=1 Tax=Imhoffiella purpurea TaxID=1249627 RepID=W9V7J7_9GAMM|nr:hypothetical protein [Imhoffiella purpurea]EXJ15379.1 hypothetical protein D779_1475 [Imhoffiella purpurea]